MKIIYFERENEVIVDYKVTNRHEFSLILGVEIAKKSRAIRDTESIFYAFLILLFFSELLFCLIFKSIGFFIGLFLCFWFCGVIVRAEEDKVLTYNQSEV